MSLIYKSNKYKFKYKYYVDRPILSLNGAGPGLELKEGSLDQIIEDIRRMINEYAQEYNSLSYENQLLINDELLPNWLDDEDDESIIDQINKYLPEFNLIWKRYYESLF